MNQIGFMNQINLFNYDSLIDSEAMKVKNEKRFSMNNNFKFRSVPDTKLSYSTRRLILTCDYRLTMVGE